MFPIELLVLGGATNGALAIRFTHLLCLAVEHDRGSGFWNKEEVDDLDRHTENKLDPEVPSPGEILLDGATNHTADDCTRISSLLCNIYAVTYPNQGKTKVKPTARRTAAPQDRTCQQPYRE